MPANHLETVSLGPPSASELPAALRLLFCDSDNAERSARAIELAAKFEPTDRKHHILVAAHRGQALVGVAWIEIRPGNVGTLQRPGFITSEPEQTAVELINSAVHQAMIAGVRFVQTLLKTDASHQAQQLRQCGFRHAADLLYLVSPGEAFPRGAPTNQLEFQPLDESAAAMARMANLIQQTYQGSRDCPAAHGLQPIGDALASYRATGEFDPSRWLIVRKERSDIGCLLLTEHPVSSFPIPHSPFLISDPTVDWELIYMGLIPLRAATAGELKWCDMPSGLPVKHARTG